MENKDDILETALNSGIAFSAKKHNIEQQEVYKIVMDFKKEIGDLCSCEKARLNGSSMMCFMCDGNRNRIRL